MSFTVAGKSIGPIGFGMGGLTAQRWSGLPATEDAIKTLKAALNAGANFWNAGTNYGTAEYNSLHLLNAYFTRYPEDAERVVISVKAALDMKTASLLCNADGIRSEIETCHQILDGKCRIDIFQAARLDPTVPVEITVGAIAEAVQAGRVRGIGLSEVSAASVRRAAAVHPIAAVEIELSLFETGALRNGVAQACADRNIPIVAYSPLGRGFLTGQLQKYEDMAQDDYRRMFPRFQPDVFDENLRLVKEIEKVARAKACTPAQVAVAWVIAQIDVLGIPVIPIPGSVAVPRTEENTRQVALSADEIDELGQILERIELKGDRVPEKFRHLMEV